MVGVLRGSLCDGHCRRSNRLLLPLFGNSRPEALAFGSHRNSGDSFRRDSPAFHQTGFGAAYALGSVRYRLLLHRERTHPRISRGPISTNLPGRWLRLGEEVSAFSCTTSCFGHRNLVSREHARPGSPLVSFNRRFLRCAHCLAAVSRRLSVVEQFTFYERLADSRAKSRGGITDSYRHLRENGNSFFIVVLESLLGLLLVGASMLGDGGSTGVSLMDSKLLLYLAILFIWILPAALVWLVATFFERRFSGADAEPAAPGAGKERRA